MIMSNFERILNQCRKNRLDF